MNPGDDRDGMAACGCIVGFALLVLIVTVLTLSIR